MQRSRNAFLASGFDFFKQAAGAIGATTQIPHWSPFAEAEAETSTPRPHEVAGKISFPRVFTGEQLKMLAFPLGGVGSGSLALGGRGQLRDWEIFNRPNKGFSPPYAFPAIWIKAGDAQPIARVLEARILPPYEGQDGLGSNNSPGLSRIATAEFTAQYPLAHLQFQDPSLPVKIELDAFSPFIPHDPDASGLPVAILRYRVTNPGRSSAAVASGRPAPRYAPIGVVLVTTTVAIDSALGMSYGPVVIKMVRKGRMAPIFG